MMVRMALVETKSRFLKVLDCSPIMNFAVKSSVAGIRVKGKDANIVELSECVKEMSQSSFVFDGVFKICLF